MMTDTAGTRTRDRPRRRAGGRRGGRHPQGHPPRRGRQRGDRRRAGRYAGPRDPGGPRPAPRLRPLPRAHPDDRHRGHRLLRGGPGPRSGGPPARRSQGSSVPSAPSAAAGEPRTRSEPEPPPAGRWPGADALPVAKTGTGPCEQIRVLLARRRSAMKARVAAHRQITALPATAPDAVRTRLAPSQRRGGSSAPWPARAPHRPPTAPASTTTRTLRRLARRHRIPGRRDHRHRHRAARTDRPRRPDDARHQGAAPSSPPPPCSPAPATTPTESAPRHPSPPCAAPPRSPPAPGRTNRHRLNRGGDRQANWALHQIALVRLSSDPRTKAYAARLTATGKSRKEILRRPRTRHRPPSTAPADPPPTRTPHRRPAPRAPRTRTHPPPKPPTT